MKQKTGQTKSKKRFISIALVLAVSAGLVLVMLQQNKIDAAPAAKPIGSKVQSQFSFAGATDWWQGATNKTSMALFHRKDGCFTSVEHKKGAVNVATELHKTYDMLTRGGYTVAQDSTLQLTMTTATGPRQYNLYQTSVSGSGEGGKLMGGQELGYIQLSDGYLKVMGYCDTADQLASTFPALRAMKFDGSIK